MKEQILEILENNNIKVFARLVKKNEKIWDWVESKNTGFSGLNTSEKIYNAIYDKNPICKNGNRRKFNSFTAGYGNCGRASTCQCVKEIVSKKVSKAKQSLSISEKERINKKRADTNLEKYGVTNAGQTETAINNHKEFYTDKDKVAEQIDKQKATMLKKYGVTNAAYIPEVIDKKIETLKLKYGVDNPMKNKNIAKQSSATRKLIIPPRHFIELSYAKLKTIYQNEFDINMLTPVEKYNGVSNHAYYEFECNKGHTFSTYIDCGHRPVCKICNPTPVHYKSKQELEMLNLVQSWGLECESGNKSLLGGKELDIYIPSKKIAIEYCGIYWHSEAASGKHKKYHQTKFLECKEKDVSLLTVFSNDWLHKPEILISILKNKLGLIKNNIYARKCQIKEITKKEAYAFFENNHIQGGLYSDINLALVYEDNIVSVLSLSKSRYNKNIEWEFTRFASIIETNITGGLSKLFSYFKKTYNPKSVITYADLRFGEGNAYGLLGFEKTKTLTPNYWYTANYEQLSSRIKYQKHKIKDLFENFNSSITEWENMKNNGFDRIWDCGNNQWVWYR